MTIFPIPFVLLFTSNFNKNNTVHGGERRKCLRPSVICGINIAQASIIQKICLCYELTFLGKTFILLMNYAKGLPMTKTILIVDDDEKLSKMLSFLFMAKGFTVDHAKNGNHAFEKLNQNRPDAVILDLMMPGIDGFEVCKKIKGDKKLKDIPVIVLSALPSAENKGKASALGAYAYFEKPFKSSDLVSKTLEAIEIPG